MNYCSNCGAAVSKKTIPGDSIPRFVCSACDTIHYQNPNIVVGCLPVWEDKVLLCRRAIEPRKTFWNVAGGYLENGETLEEGARRELVEEANARVLDLSPLMLYSIKHINQIYIHFHGVLADLNFSPGIESEEVKLFTEEDIPWNDIAFTSSTFALQKFFLNRKNGSSEVHSGEFDLSSFLASKGRNKD